jgi:hypothetical protein
MSDYSKLPKWAQSEIETLQSNVRHYRSQLESAVEGETEVWYRGNREMQALPAETVVYFNLNGHGAPDSVRSKGVACYARDGRLIVHDVGIGQIDIRPEGGNRVTIGVVGR